MALQLAARRSGRPDLAALAAFLVPVSVFQVLPDWVLAELVGTVLAVSTFYLGALVLSHFLIDVAGWRLTA